MCCCHAPDRIRGDGRIKCDESAAASDGQREQVHIRDLSRSVYARGVRDLWVEQTDFIRPELVESTRRGRTQPLQDGAHR